jgi:hypothetical protein
MKNKKHIYILIALFLIATSALTLFLFLKQNNIVPPTTETKDLEVLQVSPASISNVKLSLVTDKTSINQGENAVISIKSTTVPTSYKFLGFIAAIKVPKSLTPTLTSGSFPSALGYDFVYPANADSSLIKDRGTYWEVQALGAKKASSPVALSTNTTIFTFNITSTNTTTGNAAIEFAIDSDGSYPAVVSENMTLANLTTANTTISLNPVVIVAPTISLTATTKTVGDAAFTIPYTTNSIGAKTFTSSNTAVATITNAGVVTIRGAGTSTITFNVAATGNYSANSVTATLTVNAAPVVADGNVNGTGGVDVADIGVIIDVIFGNHTPTSDEIARGDLVKDGQLDLLDAMKIVDIIFN